MGAGGLAAVQVLARLSGAALRRDGDRPGGHGLTSAVPAPVKRRFRSPRPLRRLLPRLRPFRLRLALAAICLVVAAAVGLAFPLVVRYLLDAAFQSRDRGLL